VPGIAARTLTALAGLLAAVAPVALAGCAGQGGDDLSKVTYPRTVVPPAGQQPGADSGRLSAEGLRLIDPCGLLDPAVLAEFGVPDDNVGQDFDGCRNYMSDAGGASLNLSVRVGDPLTSSDVDKASEPIGEFLARTTTVEGACFVTLVMDGVDPPVGVTVQSGYQTADPCPAARAVAADAARRLPTTAPVRQPVSASLLPLDPCTLPGALPGTAVPRAASPDAFGLHQCSWRNPDGAELELEFGYRDDPARQPAPPAPEPVDLGGGVTGHQVRTEQTFPQCKLSWLHLAGGAGEGEVVDIEVRDIRDTGLDVCGAAVTFAKGLLPKLPT